MSGEGIRIELSAAPTREDVAFIDGALMAYFDSRAGPLAFRPLGVMLRDRGGHTLGGLHGHTYADWLFIEQIWIPEPLRRRGHGARLMEMAEAEAIRRGCHAACVNGFDFTTPEFYLRLGYRVALALDDYPVGHRTLVFTKSLRPQPVAPS